MSFFRFFVFVFLGRPFLPYVNAVTLFVEQLFPPEFCLSFLECLLFVERFF